jgi:hypothetical protein
MEQVNVNSMLIPYPGEDVMEMQEYTKALMRSLAAIWDVKEVAETTRRDPALSKLLTWSELSSKDEIAGESQELKFLGD